MIQRVGDNFIFGTARTELRKRVKHCKLAVLRNHEIKKHGKLKLLKNITDTH